MYTTLSPPGEPGLPPCELPGRDATPPPARSMRVNGAPHLATQSRPCPPPFTTSAYLPPGRCACRALLTLRPHPVEQNPHPTPPPARSVRDAPRTTPSTSDQPVSLQGDPYLLTPPQPTPSNPKLQMLELLPNNKTALTQHPPPARSVRVQGAPTPFTPPHPSPPPPQPTSREVRARARRPQPAVLVQAERHIDGRPEGCEHAVEQQHGAEPAQRGAAAGVQQRQPEDGAPGG